MNDDVTVAFRAPETALDKAVRVVKENQLLIALGIIGFVALKLFNSQRKGWFTGF